jgi:hypothetical protein
VRPSHCLQFLLYMANIETQRLFTILRPYSVSAYYLVSELVADSCMRPSHSLYFQCCSSATAIDKQQVLSISIPYSVCI